MMSPESGTQVEVKCHSGYTYDERPVEFRVGGQVYRVTSITAEGRTPEGKWFQVVTGSGQTFRLSYFPAEDKWSISGLDSAYNKK